MDAAVLRAKLKWPDVPDVYGWLRLDRRGNWRVRNPEAAAPEFDPIGNRSLRDFIGRNYSVDARGRWYFQNGPQRVFVSLAYAPFVYRLERGALLDQCGASSAGAEAAWLDEEGSLVVLCRGGRLGILDDRDLAGVAEGLVLGEFRTGDRTVPVGRLTSETLEKGFGFIREPAP